MAQGKRNRLSTEQRIDMWQRWKAGESLHEIGRAFGKGHGSIRFLLKQLARERCETRGVQSPFSRCAMAYLDDGMDSGMWNVMHTAAENPFVIGDALSSPGSGTTTIAWRMGRDSPARTSRFFCLSGRRLASTSCQTCKERDGWSCLKYGR